MDINICAQNYNLLHLKINLCDEQLKNNFELLKKDD